MEDAATLNAVFHRRFVKALSAVPTTALPEGRNALMAGLPPGVIAALSRSSSRMADLSLMLTQLGELGRLVETGERPLIIVAENALSQVEGTWLGRELKEIIKELERHYGGEASTEPPSPLEPEKLLFKGQDERVPFAFLQRALEASRSIARFRVPRIFDEQYESGDDMFGTGWIIAPGLMITNHHVVEARDWKFESPASPHDFELQAERVVVWFDYLREGGAYLECQGASLAASSQALDYAIVRLSEAEKIADRKPLTIVEQPLKLQHGGRLNIVQHSRGGPLIYAIRNNFYVGADDTRFLHYLTDTEGGASGSPVLNDTWKVLGLHRGARPIPPEYYINLPKDRRLGVPEETVKGEIITYHNEGIAIHAILADLDPELQQEIREAQGWE